MLCSVTTRDDRGRADQGERQRAGRAYSARRAVRLQGGDRAAAARQGTKRHPTKPLSEGDRITCARRGTARPRRPGRRGPTLTGGGAPPHLVVVGAPRSPSASRAAVRRRRSTRTDDGASRRRTIFVMTRRRATTMQRVTDRHRPPPPRAHRPPGPSRRLPRHPLAPRCCRAPAARRRPRWLHPPRPTQLDAALGSHAHFVTPLKLRRDDAFGVMHYAGAVTYEVGAFIEKNRDTLFSDLVTLCLGSSSKCVATPRRLSAPTRSGSRQRFTERGTEFFPPLRAAACDAEESTLRSRVDKKSRYPNAPPPPPRPPTPTPPDRRFVRDLFADKAADDTAAKAKRPPSVALQYKKQVCGATMGFLSPRAQTRERRESDAARHSASSPTEQCQRVTLGRTNEPKQTTALRSAS